MGIYVFETEFLAEILREDAADPNSSHDFGKDIVPRLVRDGNARAHHFSKSALRSGPEAEPYWRDVGTLDAYFAANIDLTNTVPALDLYDREWPIWTYSEMTAPAKFVHDEDGRRGEAISSLVSGDCIVSGASLHHSLLFTGCRINSYSTIDNAVLMPRVKVGRSVRLKNVIVDRGVEIPEGLVVGEDPVLDAARFRRTENGICLITAKMIEALNA
jgi:glucose-1-phosphate adenylyltransferase